MKNSRRGGKRRRKTRSRQTRRQRAGSVSDGVAKGSVAYASGSLAVRPAARTDLSNNFDTSWRGRRTWRVKPHTRPVKQREESIFRIVAFCSHFHPSFRV